MCLCEAEVVVSVWRSYSALWGRWPAVVECNISRKVEWMSRANCMASLVTRSNSDGFFPMGTPGGACLCSPSQGYRRSQGKTSSSCDISQCHHVKASSTEHIVPHCCLSWKGWNPLQIPIVTSRHPWFNHLTAWTIWQWQLSWKINTIGHMLHNIFYFLF
jgi:hypothetical protein